MRTRSCGRSRQGRRPGWIRTASASALVLVCARKARAVITLAAGHASPRSVAPEAMRTRLPASTSIGSYTPITSPQRRQRAALVPARRPWRMVALSSPLDLRFRRASGWRLITERNINGREQLWSAKSRSFGGENYLLGLRKQNRSPYVIGLRTTSKGGSIDRIRVPSENAPGASREQPVSVPPWTRPD